MKKSEKYQAAMVAVVNSIKLDAEVKLEVLEQLMSDKSSAVWCENREKAE